MQLAPHIDGNDGIFGYFQRSSGVDHQRCHEWNSLRLEVCAGFMVFVVFGIGISVIPFLLACRSTSERCGFVDGWFSELGKVSLGVRQYDNRKGSGKEGHGGLIRSKIS